MFGLKNALTTAGPVDQLINKQKNGSYKTFSMQRKINQNGTNCH